MEEGIALQLQYMLFAAVFWLPACVLSVVGIILGLFKFSRFRKAGLLSVAAFLFLLVIHASVALLPFAAAYMLAAGVRATLVHDIVATANYSYPILTAISYLLLISAVWVDRGAKEPAPGPNRSA